MKNMLAQRARPAVAAGLLLLLSSLAHAAEPVISLAGQWRFELDRGDAGLEQQWFQKQLPDTIRLPGSLEEQGYGDPPSTNTQWTAGIGAALLNDPKYAPYRQTADFKTPFWLTPERHYVGPAWYQRQIQIPPDWRSRRVVLYLERPHWQTLAWLDDRKLGLRNGLGMAHVFDLGTDVSSGPHTLTIRIDNRVLIPVGHDAHSVSDQTQGNWNGVTGRLELRATAPVWFDDLQIFPHVASRSITVRGRMGNATRQAGRDSIHLAVRALANGEPAAQPEAESTLEIQWDAAGGRFETELALGPTAALWDEFHPALHRLTATLQNGGESRTATFGLRELGIQGTQFTINGRPIFLRGTLECCIFPLTGYPPTDVAHWRRVLGIARAHGLNHLRFHSWCPPEAAFQAADEMGFYYQVECSCWAAFGDGSPLDQWIYDESRRMVKAYGNHPSFLLMVPSNEPGGKNRDRFLGDWVAYWSERDSRRKYTAGSGWPAVPQNNYLVTPGPRMQATHELNRPPQTTSDYRDYIASQKVPVVSHEIGQWCVYPNFNEIPKYTGSLKPGNLEIFQDFLKKSGMGNQAADFVRASGKFQALLYKEEIEEALRTPGMAGFQLLDLHDFPGQGTAPVGVLDAFWDDKGYITADEYRRFCAPTVPLARLETRVFTSDQAFQAAIEVAHFGPADLAAAKPLWTIRDPAGRTVASGEFRETNIPTGRLTALGNIRLPLNGIRGAARLNLQVSLAGTSFTNDWDFWVYPAQLDVTAPGEVRVASTLDEAALAILRGGGNLLLLPGPKGIGGNTLGVFRPIFWNRVTFPSQREHTVGILCDPKHPAFAQFPTDFHSNWQWWDLAEHSKPMVLDALPQTLEPLVQAIDDWNVCRKLGLVIEARVAGGRLLVCSLDLTHDLATRPVARQLRRSLLDYMASPDFQPAVQLEVGQIQSLFRELSLMEKLGATVVSADSAAPGYPASQIVDGNPDSFWHTPWEGNPPGFPHDVIIRFNEPARAVGLRCLPRQDVHNGQIKDYLVAVSDDGRSWREIARGQFQPGATEQNVKFSEPATFKFLKLTALTGYRNELFATLAELTLIPAP